MSRRSTKARRAAQRRNRDVQYRKLVTLYSPFRPKGDPIGPKELSQMTRGERAYEILRLFNWAHSWGYILPPLPSTLP